MKKLLSLALSVMLLFSFAAAEGAETSLGALLRHESAVLFSRNGVTVTVNEIIQSGPEFFLKTDCKNENGFPVLVLFELPNRTGQDPFFSFRLNGEDYYGAATTADEDGNYYSGLYLPADGELKSKTITLDPVDFSSEGPWLSLEEITEGSFCLTVYMRPAEEEAGSSYAEWPVLFIAEQIRFNMAYEGGPLPDPVDTVIPPLEAFAEGTVFFSVDGVALTCREAAFDLDFTSMSPAMMGTAVLRNDTDRDFTAEILDLEINGRKGGAFRLQADGGSSLFPAKSETVCSYSLPLNNGMMPGEVTRVSMVLCCKDPASGKNLLYQPLTMTVAQP